MPEQMDAGTKVRILFIIPSLGVGGAEWQLYYLLKGMNKERFDVSLAVFYSTGFLTSEFEAIPELKIYYLHKKHGLDFAYLFMLRTLIQKNRFDIVQAYNASARLVGLLLARLGRVPRTVMAERNASPIYSSFGSRIYHFCERFAMRRASVVVANSEAGRLFCKRRGIAAERIRLINNGLDLQRLQSMHTRAELNLPEQGLIIGMVARMFPQKDPITFLRAARLVLSQRPDTRFLLVGGGPILAQIQDLALQWNLRPQVIITGQVSAVADYLAAMDVVLLTSRQSEGCPNAILEAMAMAKPVIVTDVPGNRELVEHEQSGLIVAPGNGQELCRAILYLMDDAARRKELGTRAHHVVLQRFDMRVMIDSYEKLYCECVA